MLTRREQILRILDHFKIVAMAVSDCMQPEDWRGLDDEVSDLVRAAVAYASSMKSAKLQAANER